MPASTSDIAKRILGDLKTRLSDIWDSSLVNTDRILIEACVTDASELMIQSLAVMPNTPEAAALKREMAHVNAQLLNLDAAEKERVVKSFWDTVQGAIKTAASIALAVA